jgi:prepilin-type N-terminal cleavage/methylation domain-containing protein
MEKLPKPKIYEEDGFTLIELLIVIVIVGIMAGILVSVINVREHQAMARDSKRVNDILAIQIALTSSIADSKILLTDTSACVDCNSVGGSDDLDGTGWIKFNDIGGRGLRDYIPVLPIDPLNEGTNRFYYYSDGFYFEINTPLESDKYAENMQRDGGNDDNMYERGTDLNLN